MKDFKGKTAVVTGGASGVGRAMCELFAFQGMNVVMADIELHALDTSASALREKGFNILGVKADVTSSESMQRLAEKSVAKFGNIHILCNNAGIGLKEAGKNFWEHAPNDWRWAFEVNSLGITNGIRAFVPGMLEHGEEGHVVNTSSGNGGLSSFPNSPIYAASKAAVTSMSEVLHYQFTSLGCALRAHVLFPGPNLVNTNLLAASRNRPEALKDGTESADEYKTFQELSDAIGYDLQITEPEEVAEFCLQCIKKNQFWMLADSDTQDDRIRKRAESMLSRSNPTPPII